MRIKKGDQVVVIAGKKQDKGKRGEVIKVLPKKKPSGSSRYKPADQAPASSAGRRAHYQSRYCEA